jgi:hypothetical protein
MPNMANLMFIEPPWLGTGHSRSNRRKSLICDVKGGKGASKARKLPFKICWKYVVSKLVGEDSLTGFLFVYASNGACW